MTHTSDDDHLPIDWIPIYISSTIILLSLLFLYYKLILELLNALKISLDMARGMMSNRYSLSHLIFGWIQYLFGIKHEYGFGSGSTASQIALKNIDNLWNKTIIVTGGNSGIGYSLCYALSVVSHEQCEQIHVTNHDTPCCIIMASRNTQKSENAIKQILKKYPKADIRFIQLDLSKLQSIIMFVNSLKKLPQNIQNNIQILINNAGVAMVLKGQSVKFDENMDQRMEKNFAVNYLGPFILTQLIYDTYFKNNDKECRIINTSSIIHTVVSVYYEEDLLEMDRMIKYHLDKEYFHVYAYGVSKLFNIIHTRMMMDEYSKHNILINSCHPGTSVGTGLTAQHFSSQNTFLVDVASKLLWFLWKTNDQCAATSMLMACDKRIKSDNITGAYFEDCGVKEASNYAKNKKIRDNLKKFSFSIYNNIK